MHKVLIITYYWPPAGGGGVQRWLKFAKYLPEFGWEPVIYAPENADYPLVDETLNDDVPDDLAVVRKPIFEIRKWYRSLVGEAGKSNNSGSADSIFYQDKSRLSLMKRMALLIRSNVFIPDARCTWIGPSSRFLNTYIRENQIETVISTGPPHSMHIIALRLKKKNPSIRWIADFRDPWTSIEYYEHLMLTRWADRKHHRLEREVLTSADRLITVSPSWAGMFQAHGAKNPVVITNGYDEDNFEHERPDPDPGFVICHAGTLQLDRDISSLWNALEELRLSHPGLKNDLELKFLGTVDPAVLNQLEARGIPFRNLGYVSHARAILEMQKSHLLLLLRNESVAENSLGRIPGKVFEYMASECPVLHLSDGGDDCAQIIEEYPRGYNVPDNEDSIQELVLRIYTKNKSGAFTAPLAESVSAYSRRNLTGKLAETLQSVQ